MQDLDSQRIFDIQADELLRSNKTIDDEIMEELLQLKTLLEQLPSKKVKFGPGSKFLNRLVKAKLNLEAQVDSPVRVDILGSFLLKTQISSKLDVDIAVEMASTILWKESHQNYDYFDKRLIFLHAIKEFLEQHNKKVSIDLFQHDPLKPILIIEGLPCKVRIIPTASENSMKIPKLQGDRNCVRKEPGDKTPTPFYNQQVLEDMHFRQQTEFLYSLFNEAESSKEALKLLKIWWSKRSTDSYGKINGFHLSMFLAYLLHSEAVNKDMKPRTIFRLTMEWLSKLKLPLEMSFDDSVDKCWSKAFQICFFEGPVNILHRVFPSQLEKLIYESKRTISQLQQQLTDPFASLFMDKLHFEMKYDVFIHINLESLKMDLHPGFFKERFIPLKIIELLQKGLSRRFKRYDVKYLKEEKIVIGVSVERETLLETKILGPLNDQEEQCQEFAMLWGDKSALQRQPNGSFRMEITFTHQRHPDEILEPITRHLLHRHLGLPYASIELFCEPLWSVGFVQANRVRRLALEKAFENLQSKVGTLKLPLRVQNLQATHPVFRLTALDVPSAISTDEFSDDFGSSLEVIPVVCKLDGSSKWPENHVAIQRIKTAFYIKFAKSIRSSHDTLSVGSHEFVDILLDGFVFRLRIFYPRELAVRKLQGRPYRTMKQELQHLPRHGSQIRAIAIRYGSFPMASRICQRWCREHMFTFSTEVIELILSYVYLHPAPFDSPQTATGAFHRFLNLLHTFNWNTAPLVIDFMQTITPEHMKKIDSEMQKWRSKKSGQAKAMFIATIHDLKSEFFTFSNPDQEELKRLVTFARASEKQLRTFRQAKESKQALGLFKTPLKSFDLYLRLQPTRIEDYELNTFKTKKNVKRKRKAHDSGVKKRRKLNNETKTFPLCNFNLRTQYLESLQETFGDVADFRTSICGGDVVVMKWKKGLLTKEQKEAWVADMVNLGTGIVKNVSMSYQDFLSRGKVS